MSPAFSNSARYTLYSEASIWIYHSLKGFEEKRRQNLEGLTVSCLPFWLDLHNHFEKHVSHSFQATLFFIAYFSFSLKLYPEYLLFSIIDFFLELSRWFSIFVIIVSKAVLKLQIVQLVCVNVFFEELKQTTLGQECTSLSLFFLVCLFPLWRSEVEFIE